MKKILFLFILIPGVLFSQAPGTFAYIYFPSHPIAPGGVNKLYPIGTHLYWNGVRLDSVYSGGSAFDTTGLKAWVLQYITVKRDTAIWQYEVNSDSQNGFTVGFSLQSTSEILFNGYPLRKTQWSGTNTSTLTVAISTKQYDFITIIR